MTCDLNIADLQTVGILEQRRNLGKGELSSIAFAMRTGLAFLSDDQKARKLALEVLTQQLVQTTPHLVGWLFFHNHLTDGDKPAIIADHKAMNRPLAKFFDEMYLEALRCRLMAKPPRAEDEAWSRKRDRSNIAKSGDFSACPYCQYRTCPVFAFPSVRHTSGDQTDARCVP